MEHAINHLRGFMSYFKWLFHNKFALVIILIFCAV